MGHTYRLCIARRGVSALHRVWTPDALPAPPRPARRADSLTRPDRASVCPARPSPSASGVVLAAAARLTLPLRRWLRLCHPAVHRFLTVHANPCPLDASPRLRPPTGLRPRVRPSNPVMTSCTSFRVRPTPPPVDSAPRLAPSTPSPIQFHFSPLHPHSVDPDVPVIVPPRPPPDSLRSAFRSSSPTPADPPDPSRQHPTASTVHRFPLSHCWSTSTSYMYLASLDAYWLRHATGRPRASASIVPSPTFPSSSSFTVTSASTQIHTRSTHHRVPDSTPVFGHVFPPPNK